MRRITIRVSRELRAMPGVPLPRVDPHSSDAPHARPEVVHAFLLRTYAERKEGLRPLPEQRRLLPGRAFAATPPPPILLRLDERVLRQVVEAEVNLYRAACNEDRSRFLEQLEGAIRASRRV